jgi:hypothetical protein
MPVQTYSFVPSRQDSQDTDMTPKLSIQSTPLVGGEEETSIVKALEFSRTVEVQPNSKFALLNRTPSLRDFRQWLRSGQRKS